MTAAAASVRAGLPPVRGRYTAAAPLARMTWFRTGGTADILFAPADLQDLQDFLRDLPPDMPRVCLGAGSNLLARDGGVRGVVIRPGAAFAGIQVDGAAVIAGAGALDMTVARIAARHGIAGLEFLSGIPGGIGGALRMNAGAFGAEIADVLETAWALDGRGGLHVLSPAQMGLSYRHCGVPEDWIFIRARLRGVPGDPAAIQGKMEKVKAERRESQPPGARTGGSTFANPGGKDPQGVKAWKLIDAAGCRGLVRGGAQVSVKHCNFLVNNGDATATDIEELGEEVRQRVQRHSGVDLSWEIRRIGEALQ